MRMQYKIKTRWYSFNLTFFAGADQKKEGKS